jgi:uncharacterized protein YndB with AHSA1/START domain
MTLGNRVDDFVEREIMIAASPEVIYEFFVDPAKMVQWKGTEAFLAPHVGGVYRVNVTGRNIACGEYVELVPFSRIVFTWGWEEGPLPPGSTTVEVTLTPQGRETLVRLRHSGLSGEAAQEHASGWEHYLPRLQQAAQGLPVETDPWVVSEAAGGGQG